METINEHYQYKNLLVIGNGFDKDLSLATTYKEFVNSCIFKRMYVKRTKENSNPSLLHYLYGRRFYDKWYDMESALLEYVSRRPDGSFVNNIEKDKKDYELLCSTLVDYLKSLFKGEGQKIIEQSNKMYESSAGKLLKNLLRDESNIIYSFNYTPINLIISSIDGGGRSYKEPVRLHGAFNEKSIWDERINDHSIILGIETEDINSIAPGYTFLLKSNRPEYKSTNIVSDLQKTQHVIIFGHSLNLMDSGYFVEFFENLTNNLDPKRELTIITYDDTSRIAVLDNIRKMGISVMKLFSHAKLSFILTSNIKKGVGEDGGIFDNLVDSIPIF